MHSFPIANSIYCDYVQIIESALQNGSYDVLNSKQNKLGETPLTIACRKMHIDYIKILLENDNIDPNISNNAGETPLYIILHSLMTYNTTYYNSEINNYANENDEDNNNNWNVSRVNDMDTSIHMGAIDDKTNPSKLQERLNYYSSLPTTVYNCTPQHREILRLFLEHDKINVNIEFRKLCECVNDVDIINMFIEHKSFDVNYVNRNMNHLMSTCSVQNETIVKLLLENTHIDVNYQNSTGITAFHITCVSLYGKTNILKILLDHDLVNVNLPDNHGITPYVSCLYNYFRGVDGVKSFYLETLKVLNNSDRIDKYKLVNNTTPLNFVLEDYKNMIKNILNVYDKDDIITALI